MEKGNKKQEILDASLELFSVQGFEATSISQIAEAVGIQKSSLYSHFRSKQAILDALEKEILEQYEKHSLFARMDWDISTETNVGQKLSPDTVAQKILDQIRYIIHDPHISKARKMLVIEQFRNPELARLQTKQNYTDVIHYFTGMIEYMIRQEVLLDDDTEIMTAQLCLPISEWINLCDREPDSETEVMELVERHIRQFFRIYGK